MVLVADGLLRIDVDDKKEAVQAFAASQNKIAALLDLHPSLPFVTSACNIDVAIINAAVEDHLTLLEMRRSLVATQHDEAASGAADSGVAKAGPAVVEVLRGHASGSLSMDGLRLESHSNFSSVSANVSVTEGKWAYEVALGTAGIQQIGWTTGGDEKWTSEEGACEPV